MFKCSNLTRLACPHTMIYHKFVVDKLILQFVVCSADHIMFLCETMSTCTAYGIHTCAPHRAKTLHFRTIAIISVQPLVIPFGRHRKRILSILRLWFVILCNCCNRSVSVVRHALLYATSIRMINNNDGKTVSRPERTWSICFFGRQTT